MRRRAVISTLSERWNKMIARLANLPPLRAQIKVTVNVGINSGLASVGSAKFEGLTGTRWTYTASGMVTDLAARMAAFASAGAVLLSLTTARHIAQDFFLEDLGLQQFKNVSEPVQVFRLRAEKGSRDGQENSDRR